MLKPIKRGGWQVSWRGFWVSRGAVGGGGGGALPRGGSGEVAPGRVAGPASAGGRGGCAGRGRYLPVAGLPGGPAAEPVWAVQCLPCVYVGDEAELRDGYRPAFDLPVESRPGVDGGDAAGSGGLRALAATGNPSL